MIDETELCKDYSNKVTFEELKKKYGIGLKPIYRILRKHGVPKRGNDKVIPNLLELLNDYQDCSIPIGKLEEKYGVTSTTMLKIIKKHGILLRSELVRYTEEQEKEFCEAYQSDMSITELYKKYNITQYTLFKILDKHGVPKDKMNRWGDKSFNRISEKVKDAVCEDYLSKMPLAEIAEKHDISDTNVMKIIERRNIRVTRDEEIKNKMSKVVELYNSGLSPEKIATIVHRGSTYITSYLREQGIELRDAKSYIKKYTANYHYMDVIDTFEKAQILGMFTADGYIEKDKNTVNINLHEDDRYYLEWVNNQFESTHPIFLSTKKGKAKDKNGKEYNKSNNYKMSLCNPHLHQTMQKHNIVHRKTYCDLGIPETVPKELYGAFLLGLFEGDGSVGRYDFNDDKTYNNGKIKGYGAFQFLAQPKLMQDISSFLDSIKLNKFTCNPIKKKESIYNNSLYKITTFDASSIILLYHLFYDHASFVMKRKHDKFLELMRMYASRGYDIGVLRSFD
jgi:Mor family transcriptional regulator